MKIRKIWVWLFFIFNYCSYANQQELNREERRIREEEIRKLEKIEAKDEIQLNELEENIEAIGDEIKSLEINGNTILKTSEIEILKKKYIGKIGGKNILNLMRELENLYLVKGYIAVRVKMDMDKADIPEGKIALKVLEGHIEEIRFKDKSKGKINIFTSFPTSKGDVLNINDLDQGIDNLNSVSSNNAKLDILAGETLGGSIIEIDNQRSKKISGAINYNDLGQKSTGRDRLKTSLIFEDIMGLNDSFTGTYQKKRYERKI